METEKCREALINATKQRALIYLNIYREGCNTVGRDKIKEIMYKGIYQSGVDKAKDYPEDVKDGNYEALCKALSNSKSKNMDIFDAEVENHKDFCIFRLNRCALVEAWKEVGLNEDEIQDMCDIAYATDFGKFETLGYEIKFDSRIACSEKSCDIHIEKKKD